MLWANVSKGECVNVSSGEDFLEDGRIFVNFVGHFFNGRENRYSELSQVLKTLFWLNLMDCRQIFEKRGQNDVFRHFLGQFWQKSYAYLARSPHSKLVYSGAKSAFRITLGTAN